MSYTSPGTGPETDDVAARLEAALDRIEAAAQRAPAAAGAPSAEIASRLDSLILQLRTALDALDE